MRITRIISWTLEGQLKEPPCPVCGATMTLMAQLETEHGDALQEWECQHPQPESLDAQD